jgi:hypothetical protein
MTHANSAPWFTKAGAATSIVPLSHFVGASIFALKGGGYGCLFSLEGIDPESRTDEDLDVRVRGVEAALRGLPQGSCLYQYARVISGFDLPRQEKYPSSVTESFVSDRLMFLNQTARFRHIDLHWCLTIEPDTGNPLGRKPKEQRIATDRQLYDLEKAATILESHMSDSIGLKLLDKDQAFQFFSYLCNLEEWASDVRLRSDVHRDHHLSGRLSIRQRKSALPQLRALVRDHLCGEVRRVEKGIHYRTLDQSVSTHHSARSDGFFGANAVPSLRLRSRMSQYRCPINNAASSSLRKGRTHAGSERSESAAQLLAQGDCVRKTRAVRACSAASRKRYQVESGIRMRCCGSTSLMSSTVAAKPPACNSRSVAFNACSSRDHGLSLTRSFLSADMRSQSSRLRAILAAAADSGESASFTSTHAQTAPDWVMAAMMESARDVLPVEAAPAISVMLPRGMPPPRTASTSAIPVANSSGACLIFRLSAAGTRLASAVST